jgi:hypothetical protein
MAAKGSSARRTIHALLTWLNLDAYTIRGVEPIGSAPSGTASARPLRRVCPYFRVYPHFHGSLTEATVNPRLTAAQQKP